MTRSTRTSISATSATCALLAVLALAGCGDSNDTSSGDRDSSSNPQATAPATTPEPTDGDTVSPAADDADLPDVCTLLSNDEVNTFTGKQVDQVDQDDAAPDAATRYCQWQGADLRLAVFLTRTTADQFDEESRADGASTVDGIGDAAYTGSGHLYVLDGTVQIDVYNSGADSVADATQAVVVATDLVDKIG